MMPAVKSQARSCIAAAYRLRLGRWPWIASNGGVGGCERELERKRDNHQGMFLIVG